MRRDSTLKVIGIHAVWVDYLKKPHVLDFGGFVTNFQQHFAKSSASERQVLQELKNDLLRLYYDVIRSYIMLELFLLFIGTKQP